MASPFNFGLSRIPVPLPRDHKRELIAGGNAGTAQTIARMRDLVTQGKRDFRLRIAVGKLLQECSPKNYSCYAKAVYNFCTHQIKYVFDPSGVELIEAPYRILESGVADCDSIVVLAAAMLESIGLPCRFVTVKANRATPNEFSHVYLQTQIPHEGWVGLDCTMPDKAFGWEPPAEFPRKTWPASRDKTETRETDAMAGLGMDVPYVEHAKGVIVGKEWDFRDESALVVSAPESIELDPLNTQKPGPLEPPHQEFFFKDQLPGAPRDSDLYAEPVAEAPPSIPWGKVLFVGGLLLLLVGARK